MTKLRGGYYTPDPVARFLAAWVGDSGDRLLEPSCGDGAILRHLPMRGSTVGVELDELEAAAASMRAPESEVITSDLFAWFDESQIGEWDGVAGNPPFIRFQHWQADARERAFDLMRSAGLRPSKLTNAWVPFTVASALALREGGRLGLVLPAELLQVTYAAELRAFLVDIFSELTAVAFRSLLFPGVLQEVVLLLGVRGAGPAAMRVVEFDDAAGLPASPSAVTRVPHAPALLHDREKWTRYFLPPQEIEALRLAREHPGMRRLGELADVDVGVVTGRNAFFVLTPTQADRLGVRAHCIPLVSKSAHVRGTCFTEADLALLGEEEARCMLLSVPPSAELATDQTLASYVVEGESEGVHEGYKCSIRKSWWSVPSVWTPDAFLLRQIYDHPRIIANATAATSTDTIHRVRMLGGSDPRVVAAASVNSATFAFSEVLGRSYGGGVLELEPTEAEALPFPDPSGLTLQDVSRIEDLTRAGRLLEALDLADGVLLIDGCGMDPRLVERLRDLWVRLRDRRLARSQNARA